MPVITNIINFRLIFANLCIFVSHQTKYFDFHR